MLHIGEKDNLRAITGANLVAALRATGGSLGKLLVEVNRVGGLCVFQRTSGDEMTYLGYIDLGEESWNPVEPEVCSVPEGWKR